MLRRGAYLGLVFTLILTAATQIGAQQNGECTCVHVSNTGIISVAHVCVCVYMYVCVCVCVHMCPGALLPCNTMSLCGATRRSCRNELNPSEGTVYSGISGSCIFLMYLQGNPALHGVLQVVEGLSLQPEHADAGESGAYITTNCLPTVSRWSVMHTLAHGRQYYTVRRW